jgi:hypothetical protein
MAGVMVGWGQAAARQVCVAAAWQAGGLQPGWISYYTIYLLLFSCSSPILFLYDPLPHLFSVLFILLLYILRFLLPCL